MSKINLKDKKIVITGASSGIGAELVKLLADNNKIIACARNIEKIIDHQNVIKIKCDVSIKEEIDNLIEKSFEILGDVDIFFANAGFAYYEKLEKADFEHIEKIFKTNVYAPIYSLLKLKEYKKDSSFQFIITASAMSFNAIPGYSLYSSTKYALKGFFDSYKYELKNNQMLQMVFPIATYTSFFNVAGTDNLPWPRQKSEVVARKILKGVIKKKKYIFPFEPFKLILFLNKFFPVFKIYNFIEYKKFIKNYENNKVFK